MRAAIAIVGAIAAASIMIALAFILSDGGANEGGTTTVVRRVVEAPPPAGEGSGGAAAGIGGPRPCGGGYTVENTSCQVGEQVHSEYESGHPGDIFVKDEETGSTLTFVCKSETAPITCIGEEGEVVYFGD